MINFYVARDKAQIALILSDKISAQLNRGRVLWLIGGGSVIDIAVMVAKHLSGHKNLRTLTVTLTDERYGHVGHSDSNWRQLLDTGFSLEQAELKPVLLGKDLQSSVKSYSNLLESEVSSSDYSLALGGMGTDGHIFGIKPHSPAVDSQQPVVGYEWQDYIRVTPTIRLIKQLDEIIIYAAGEAKHDQLDRMEQGIPAQEQPAQLLKQAKMVSIYNDYKGEKL